MLIMIMMMIMMMWVHIPKLAGHKAQEKDVISKTDNQLLKHYKASTVFILQDDHYGAPWHCGFSRMF